MPKLVIAILGILCYHVYIDVSDQQKEVNMNMEEKPVQVLLRILPSEVAKLDALEKGLNARE